MYIYNSYNLGNIVSSSKTYAQYISGLVGVLSADSTYTDGSLSIYNSYNMGNIESDNPYGIVYISSYIIENSLNPYTFDKVYYNDNIVHGSNISDNNLISTNANAFATAAFASTLNANLSTIDTSNVPSGYTLKSWVLSSKPYPVFVD